MRDTAVVVSMAHQVNGGGITQVFNGKMAGGPLGPFFTQKALTAGDISAMYEMGRQALGL